MISKYQGCSTSVESGAADLDGEVVDGGGGRRGGHAGADGEVPRAAGAAAVASRRSTSDLERSNG
jgi:hypothetical protein